MQNQVHYFYELWIQMLEVTLPQFVGICFTADEVKYMLDNLKCAMALDNFVFEPMIFQHMYDRFSLAIPRFTEAWNAIEKCESQDELMKIEEEYNMPARLAMMVMDVRSRSFDWRQACSITRLKG